jgi:hypothetical protein
MVSTKSGGEQPVRIDTGGLIVLGDIQHCQPRMDIRSTASSFRRSVLA